MSQPAEDIGLRRYVELLETEELVHRVDGADWDREIGALTDIGASLNDPRALLFDSIEDYPDGFRVLTLPYVRERMQALALGFPPESTGVDLVREWKDRMAETDGVDPRPVETGPVQQNVMEGDDVDLTRFPAPRWHDADGGRFIGTGNAVITSDTDGEWVNVGVYRNQLHDENTVGVVVNQVHHGWGQMEEWWERGEDAPIVVDLGPSPYVYAGACTPMASGFSELEVAGSFNGAPIDVIVDDDTGLPVPAHSELAIIGHVPPPDERVETEGPFGECSGYYVGGVDERTVIEVEKVWYRDDPILQGCPTIKGPSRTHALGAHLVTSARTWESIEDDVPGLTGVYSLYQPCQTGSSILVLAIDQQYAGHAMQAGLAALSSQAAVTMNRMVIVVDDDVDPSDVQDVLFALTTRCDPESDVETVTGVPSFFLDARITPEKRESGDFTASSMVVDACEPYHWRDEFPEVVEVDPEYRDELYEEWDIDDWW